MKIHNYIIFKTSDQFLQSALLIAIYTGLIGGLLVSFAISGVVDDAFMKVIQTADLQL